MRSAPKKPSLHGYVVLHSSSRSLCLSLPASCKNHDLQANRRAMALIFSSIRVEALRPRHFQPQSEATVVPALKTSESRPALGPQQRLVTPSGANADNRHRGRPAANLHALAPCTSNAAFLHSSWLAYTAHSGTSLISSIHRPEHPAGQAGSSILAVRPANHQKARSG